VCIFLAAGRLKRHIPHHFKRHTSSELRGRRYLQQHDIHHQEKKNRERRKKKKFQDPLQTDPPHFVQVTPPLTALLVLLSLLPCLLRVWRTPRPSEFLRCVAYSYFCGFMFGWHVHEKAILTAVVPLALLAVESRDEAGRYFFLSTGELGLPVALPVQCRILTHL
jgi:hypothetical protein